MIKEQRFSCWENYRWHMLSFRHICHHNFLLVFLSHLIRQKHFWLDSERLDIFLN
jgi:hypothetical protein